MGDHVANGRTVEVPALWAAKDGSAGIERAHVTVGTVGAPGFSVDLDDERAEGAGPMWTAASASAAAVATIWSGADPAVTDIGYQITGPIDGPSAGGILTIGTLAAIRGDTLSPAVTMTGTIGPDGSIGPVGLVEHKLHAAADAGFTTVVIPALGTAPAGEPGSLIDLGTSLGLDIHPVRTLIEAYEVFTGIGLADASCLPTVDPAVQQAGGPLPADTSVVRGMSFDATQVAARAQRVTAAADAAMASVLHDPGRPVESLGRDQLAAMPALLAPLLRARMIATAAREWATANPSDADGLVDAMWIVAFAEQETTDASAGIAAWAALPADVSVDVEGAVRTAAAFEGLLDEAASATTTYMRDVLGLTIDAASHTPRLAIATRSGEIADAAIHADTDAGPGELAQAVVRTATGVAGWTLQEQLFDVVGDYSGVTDTEQSARVSIGMARTFACRVADRGLDPSWPVWSTERAVAIATHSPTISRENAWLATAAVATAAQISLAMQSVHPVQ